MKYFKMIVGWLARKSDTLIALSSMIVAVLAFHYGQTEMKRSNRITEISWKPSLSWDVGKNSIHSTEKSGFRVILRNEGLGPAKVKWIQIFWKQNRIRDWDDAYTFIYENPKYSGLLGKQIERTFAIPTDGTIIKPEGEWSQRNIIIEKQPQWRDALWENIENLTFTSCSCSLFGECKIDTWSRLSETVVKNMLLKNEYSCSADVEYPTFWLTPEKF